MQILINDSRKITIVIPSKLLQLLDFIKNVLGVCNTANVRINYRKTINNIIKIINLILFNDNTSILVERIFVYVENECCKNFLFVFPLHF